MTRPAACNDRASEAQLEVDQFMVGLAGQESGNPDAVNPDTGAEGEWQILPRNWSPWAKAAGLSPSAPKTAANQRTVTRHVLVGYFVAFGQWVQVAKAWYAGPGNHATDSNRPQGRYPSIDAYAASVMSRVGALPCG